MEHARYVKALDDVSVADAAEQDLVKLEVLTPEQAKANQKVRHEAITAFRHLLLRPQQWEEWESLGSNPE